MKKDEKLINPPVFDLIMNVSDKSDPTHFAAIENVVRGSPADIGGLRHGDILLEVNGQSIVGVPHMEVYILFIILLCLKCHR